MAVKQSTNYPLTDAVDFELTEEAMLGKEMSSMMLHRRVLLSASGRAGDGDSDSDKETAQEASARRSAPPTRMLPAETEEPIPTVPATANQMSIEAQLRFYKAKVRVLQEELDKTQHEFAEKNRENESLKAKLHESDEERNRLTRQVATMQQTLTKQKKLADDNEARALASERALEAVRRDADSAKRENRKAVSEKSAHEVRLNRALEDAERLRQELNRVKAAARDTNQDESRKVEKLTADIRRLEKQRSELIAGFKKSLKLIDVLKRQKLHLEAARLLQFREEEFVRALDWDKQAPPSSQSAMPVSSNRPGPMKKRITSQATGGSRVAAKTSSRNDDFVLEGQRNFTVAEDSGDDASLN